MSSNVRIGIEITPGELRGAVVSRGRQGLQLRHIAVEPLPEYLSTGDGSADSHILKEAFARLRQKLHTRARTAVLGISGAGLGVRIAEIPVPLYEDGAIYKDSRALLELARSGATVADFCRLEEPIDQPTHPSAGDNLQVLVAGADAPLLRTFVQGVESAGFLCAGIEPSGLSLFRLVAQSFAEERAAATIHVHSGGTELIIAEHGALQVYRHFEHGTRELGRRAGSADASVPAASAPDQGPAPGPPTPEELIEDLGCQIQRSISYYLREFPPAVEHLQCVRLLIDAPNAGAIREGLAAQIALPLHRMRLPEAVSRSPFLSLAMGGAAGESRYAAAIGLAVRGAPGYGAGPDLDLVPVSAIPIARRRLPSIPAVSGLAATVMLMCAVVWSIVLHYAIANGERRLAVARGAAETERAKVEAWSAAYQRTETKRLAIYARTFGLRAINQVLATPVPGGLSLDQLTVDANGGVYVVGKSRDAVLIGDLADRFSGNEYLARTNIRDVTGLEKSQAGHVKFELFIDSPVSAAKYPKTPEGLLASGRVRPATGTEKSPPDRMGHDEDEDEDRAPRQVARRGSTSSGVAQNRRQKSGVRG